ncbi:hypothetical protein HPB52_025463 [Rhipicephalus sanguineus]|uniref:Uncharacterized protein n=1 Tax=Rhipicephalus sanguineus TaxID=34632 RepID=A0A9D4YRF4_RHISA|nr:hypothetical protein HPB52_025463 [Rhipicephalus sanguineus]
MMPKPAARNPDGLASNGRARTVQPKSKLIKWRPCDTPKMSADDIIVVLKHCEILHRRRLSKLEIWALPSPSTVDTELDCLRTQHVEAANKLARDWNLNIGSGSVPLRGHVKLNGEVCRASSPCEQMRQRHHLKTRGWRARANWPSCESLESNVAVLTFVGRRCGYSGQKVGASEQGLAEHVCPFVHGLWGAHLTGSANCKGKFRRLQRPGNQQGAPRNKTSKASGNGGSSSAEGDFSLLDTSNAATTSKVSTRAGVDSSSPSPLELELKKR